MIITIFGAVLLTAFVIALLQIAVGAIGFFVENRDEFFALFVAGWCEVGVTALLFFGYGFGTGWGW